MTRPRRHDQPGSWYHVMNRGVDRRPIFFADTDRVDFGRLLGVGHERFGVEVHAYCLMPNHFHLLVRCPDGRLSAFVRDLTATYTRHVNDRLGRDGPMFRGRFHSVPVDTDAYLLCAVRYIHRNPLALADVGDVGDYRWSSHRTYLGHRRRPDWLRTDHVLDAFGGDVARFDAYVSDDIGTPVDGVDARPSVTELSMLIDLLLEESFGSDLSGRRAARRTVSMLAHSADAGTARRALDPLVPSEAGAYRSALSRARRHAATEPQVVELADRLSRLAA